MLSFLSDCIKTLLASDNWKMKHSAFMALSQIGEYIENIDEIAPIIDTIGQFVDNDNPRVRYACCHCIGQLSDDMSPDFQLKYLDKVMPMLARRLEDNVPRVIGHSCASLTNLLEACKHPESQIKPYIKELYAKLWQLIKTGSTFVKENALSALSALSVGATEVYFTPFYKDHIENLLTIIENANSKEFKKMIGHAIECASISSNMVGKDTFKPYAERLINDMIAIQKQIIDCPDDDGTNPQLGFLLTAWERISRLLERDFDPFVDRMMPTLITLCRNVITEGKKYEDDPDVTGEEEEDKATFNSFDDDNCFVAINMIRIFLKKNGTALAGWVKEIYNVIVPLLTYIPNESVRTVATKCLPAIIDAMQTPQTQGDIPDFAKQAASQIWSTMEIETEAEILLLHTKSMQSLLKKAGKFLNEAGLKLMYDKCIEHLQASHKRKKDQEEHHDDEEQEEEVENVLKLEKEMEDEFCCQIAEILGSLFLTHKEMTLPIVAELDKNFIENSLRDENPDRLKKFGLFLICDIIDHLGDIDQVKQQYFEVSARLQLNPLTLNRNTTSI